MPDSIFSKGFSELNLNELEIRAFNWAKKHSVIEKIALYRTGPDVLESGARYILIATAPPFPKITKKIKARLNPKTYFIKVGDSILESMNSKKYIPIPEEDILLREIVDYYNWTLNGCMHISEDLKEVYVNFENITDRLINQGKHPSQFIDEWMWYDIEPEEEIPEGFINERHKAIILFSKRPDATKNNTPEVLSEEWQKNTADKAKRYGYISLYHLIYIMAYDDQYTKQLPSLWKEYQCNIRGPKQIDISTPFLRIGIWQTLLFRWAYGKVAASGGYLNDMPYLPLHFLNEETGEPYKERNQIDGEYILLKELEDYYTRIIKIPLPILLFPKKGEIKSQTEKLWVKDPETDLNEKTQKKSSVCSTNVFPCGKGTKWENVKITLISNEMVEIETPHGKDKFTYHELGMKDRRKGDRPTILWSTLVAFAKNQGIISAQTERVDPMLYSATKRLNKRLKILFEIGDSIFKHHYSKFKKYETKIIFSDYTIVSDDNVKEKRESLFDDELNKRNKNLGLPEESYYQD